MSLFIGNIPKDMTQKELESLVNEYGTCKLSFKGSFAFANFEDEKAAQNAIEGLNTKKLYGRELNVEWCRSRPKDRDLRGKCYICDKSGHYARDCPNDRRDRRRSYAPPKYRNSRSRSRGSHSRNFYHSRNGNFRNSLDRRSRSSSRENGKYRKRRR